MAGKSCADDLRARGVTDVTLYDSATELGDGHSIC
jgi:uncharacterized protein with NAD-binding domain and iron-sulfur cluster